VDRAFCARRLFFLERAEFQALSRIAKEIGAVGAEGFAGVVVVAAVEADHLLDGFEFTGEAGRKVAHHGFPVWAGSGFMARGVLESSLVREAALKRAGDPFKNPHSPRLKPGAKWSRLKPGWNPHEGRILREVNPARDESCKTWILRDVDPAGGGSRER
jgi:hypothetical protein